MEPLIGRRATPVACAIGILCASSCASEPTPDAAFDRALREAPGPIVVAGSLYLVGGIRGRLVDEPDLRDPEGSSPR